MTNPLTVEVIDKAVTAYAKQLHECHSDEPVCAWVENQRKAMRAAAKVIQSALAGDQALKSVRPTHWMDDLGRVANDEFMRSDKAHGDYQLAYHIPCIKKRGKFVKLGSAIKGKSHDA